MSSTHETRATTARSGGGDVTTLPAIPAAALRECVERGMTRVEAAEHLGMSYRALVRNLEKHGLSIPPGKTGPKTAKSHTAAERETGTPRRCLCGCGKAFLSLHVGERISPRCRPAWSER